MSTSQLFVLLFMEVRYVYKMFENFNIASASVEVIQWRDRVDRSECGFCCLAWFIHTRVALALPFDVHRHSPFEEAGAPQFHICSFSAFINNKMADGLSWEVEATPAPLLGL
jgi:hypothetical protein